MSKNRFENEMNEKMCKFHGRIVSLFQWHDPQNWNKFIAITNEENWKKLFNSCFSFGLIETLAYYVRCWTRMFQIGKKPCFSCSICIVCMNGVEEGREPSHCINNKHFDQPLVSNLNLFFFSPSFVSQTFHDFPFQMKAIEMSSVNAMNWHISYVFQKVTISSKPIKCNNASIAHDP